MNKIILAGYGGQGMLLCGQLLSYAAMKDGLNVTWIPSYGPEMRGGAASCTVVVSEKPVGSPVVRFADLVAVMSQPAFEKYHGSVTEGGYLLYNSALVNLSDKKESIKYVGIDFPPLTAKLGNPRAANMIALGAMNKTLNCVSSDSLKAAIEHYFGGKDPALVELNKKAAEMGAAIAGN